MVEAQREGRGGSLSSTLESQGMTPGTPHWWCGTPGNADVLKKTIWTKAALLALGCSRV